MRVKISVKDLLEAFALADSGAKTTVRKVSKTETERIPALLTLEARCGSLKIRTFGEFPVAAVTTSAVVGAIVHEEGVHTCDLEDARAALGRLKKTAKRGTWVELSSDNTMDAILIKAGGSVIRIPKDYDSQVDAFADAPIVSVIPPNDIKAALDMSTGIKRGLNGSILGHVVSFGGGIAAAMDERNAEILAISAVQVDDLHIHVPRQVMTALVRSGEPARIGDGYASGGKVRIMWRLLGNRAQADTMLDFLRKVAYGKPATTTIDGDELRQALVSLSAFLTKGDAISLLPNECGVKILRYDVRDNATSLYVTREVCEAPTKSRFCDVVIETRQALADRAEVLVGALWPLPGAVTLPASRLKSILGNANGIDLCLDGDPGGPVVAHVHGDPVVHLMCQCPCPFKGVDTI